MFSRLPQHVSHRTNMELTKDPSDDMEILKQAKDFTRSAVKDLESKHSSVTWHWFTTGHSLGGLLATAVAVHEDPKIERRAAVGICCHRLRSLTVRDARLEGCLIKLWLGCDCRCVTFDGVGLIKHYRDSAFQKHDATYWRERIRDYVTFPNPINTTLPRIGEVVRLELDIHNKCAPVQYRLHMIQIAHVGITWQAPNERQCCWYQAFQKAVDRPVASC